MKLKSKSAYNEAVTQLIAMADELEGALAPSPALEFAVAKLADAVDEYEMLYLGKEPPTPSESIHAAISHGGHSRQELSELVGGASAASRILSGSRKLTHEMIMKLHFAWNIPLEILTGAARAKFLAMKYHTSPLGVLPYVSVDRGLAHQALAGH